MLLTVELTNSFEVFKNVFMLVFSMAVMVCLNSGNTIMICPRSTKMKIKFIFYLYNTEQINKNSLKKIRELTRLEKFTTNSEIIK